MAHIPTITYTNVTHKIDDGVSAGVFSYQDEDITIAFNEGSGTLYRASYNSPFNQITGSFTPNMALARFEIRVNPVEAADYGPYVGNLAYFITGIMNGVTKSFTIPINTTIFTGSDSNTYRICLLAQSELDYS